MKHAPRSQQHHDFYEKYHHQDSKISNLLGECGLVSQAIRWEAADFGGNRQMAAAFKNRPQFNFVVRTSVAVEDSDGNSIPAGLFYCRVEQSLDENTTTARCTDAN